MRLRTRIATAGTALAMIGAVGILPGAAAANAAPGASKVAAAQAQPAPTTLPVTGTTTDANGISSQFIGAISNLTVAKDLKTVTGTITGTGVAAPTDFTAPITNLAVGGSCSILNLDLGPLHLDLLGLVIDLNAIHLDITAVPGAGNLLGNLLCAVAGLLDGPGNPLGGIAALLNRLLTGLGL